ncbi:hypothetical protein ACFQ0K_18740 [Nocardioides caeni]|uniref:Uncharacterized protein n=1 Tax=Nocardioides caeni TaxID=574700 RepID=A0A4S8NB83_9ACTN|nr:hypothetical protein [Nocardioides caeni]THV13211.1 hypothetical protein E9934_09550 [Nocardioides caeni]
MLLRRALLPVLMLALVAAPLSGATAPAAAAYDPHYTWSDNPSPVVLLLPERMVRLRPTTFCWEAPSEPAPGGSIGTSRCVDGAEPSRARLADVERTGKIRFWFGRPGWRWSARLTSFSHPRRDACTSRIRPVRVSAQRFDLAPPALRGTYRVRMTGRGPEGDMVVSFSWRYGRTPGRCS